MKFKNKKTLKYIECTDECFKEGDYKEAMPAIIGEIQTLIGTTKALTTPFMKWLGDNGYAFQCYNNPDNDDMEIAIPFGLLEKTDWEITKP